MPEPSYATSTVTQTRVVTQVAEVGGSGGSPPTVPPEQIIAIIEVQGKSSSLVSKKTLVIPILMVLLYIIPEDWRVTFGGLILDDFGRHATILITLMTMWIMWSIVSDVLDIVLRGHLIDSCKASLSAESLTMVEVREEKSKFLPRLKRRYVRFLESVSMTAYALSSMSLILIVLGLLLSKLTDVILSVISVAATGNPVAGWISGIMILLSISIVSCSLNILLQFLGARER